MLFYSLFFLILSFYTFYLYYSYSIIYKTFLKYTFIISQMYRYLLLQLVFFKAYRLFGKLKACADSFFILLSLCVPTFRQNSGLRGQLLHLAFSLRTDFSAKSRFARIASSSCFLFAYRLFGKIPVCADSFFILLSLCVPTFRRNSGLHG